MVATQPTFSLPEHLTLQGAAQALIQLRKGLAEQKGPVVTLEARDLRVLDSSAVAVLLELRRELLRENRTLNLSNPPQQLQHLMALYGVSELLPN